MAEGPHDRIKRYLAEAHALEEGQIASLKSMIDDTREVDSELHRLFTEHLHVTERQRDRLERRLTELDASPSGAKSLLGKIGAMGADIASAFRDSRDQVANHLMAAYAAEHLEVATYSALRSAADTLGDEPTSRLAQEILDEERMAADNLFPHIARFSRRTMIDSGALTQEEQDENLTEYADRGYTHRTTSGL